MFVKTCLIATVAFALPLAAFAQSGDAKYCADLSAKYRTAKANEIDAAVTKAMTDCRTNPAAGIPVLEKALTDAKIPLPPRS